MGAYARYALGLTLVFLTSIGFFLGGAWAWLGFLELVIVAIGLDLIAGDELDESAFRRPWVLDGMLYATLPLMLAVTVAFAWMLAPEDLFGLGGAFERLTGYDALAAREANQWYHVLGGVATLGLDYALATVVAHELTHRTWSKPAQVVGRWLLALTGDASFAIEHVYGHHRNVGTRKDPATARRGENAYHFVLRSTVMSYLGAWKIERDRLAKRGSSPWSWRNRMHRGNLMFLSYVAFFAWAAGTTGALLFLATAAYGKAYLELVNFIEHYGLVRDPEQAVQPWHSWNCNRRMSTWLTFNLPRHSHHHAMGQKPFYELRAYPDAPSLPVGYLTMMMIALVPPLFNALMVPRVLEWDRVYAGEAERPHIEEANRLSGMRALAGSEMLEVSC